MSDLIDREKALDKIWEARRSQQVLDNTQVADLVMHGLYIAESIIEELPSVQPRKGKWIYGEHDVAMCDGYRCDNCGFFVPWDYQHKFIDFIKDYNYCPSCGADMREGDAE